MRATALSPIVMSLCLLQKEAAISCCAFASKSTGRRLGFGSTRFLPHLAGGGSATSESTPATQLSATPVRVSAPIEDQSQGYKLIAGLSSKKLFGGLEYQDYSSDEYNVVFVLGGPGAGKGTQSEMLLEHYPCVHLSAGELLREETTREGSLHAKLIKDCLVQGKIVPVDISLSLLSDAMSRASGKSSGMVFLVDGFPRNFDNLDGWSRFMKGVAVVAGVLVFQCPLSVLEERILERGKESGRSDDNLESLRRRFKTFEGDTIPVIDTLRQLQEETTLKVYDICGNQPVEKVWLDTQKAMNAVITNDIIAANVKLLEAVAMKDVDTYTGLVAAEMFGGTPPLSVMQAHESPDIFPTVEVSNARIEFISGKRVSISYDRMSSTRSCVRETRLWSHQGDGWKMVHFSRVC